MYKSLYLVFVAGVAMVSLSVAVALAQESEQASAPALPQIPGITAPDLFPRGCVDCHINLPDEKRDFRLSTLLKQWEEGVDPAFLAKVRKFSPEDMKLKGKHPKVKGELEHVRIPDACLKCHSQKSKFAPPFVQLLHGLHLVGGAENEFMTKFHGACTNCHKLDAATGSWSLGSGSEESGETGEHGDAD